VICEGESTVRMFPELFVSRLLSMRESKRAVRTCGYVAGVLA
jgi:hypothetical protein